MSKTIKYNAWLDLGFPGLDEDYYTVELPDNLSEEEVERELRNYIFTESGLSWGYEVYEGKEEDNKDE